MDPDPRHLSPYERAATLLFAARKSFTRRSLQRNFRLILTKDRRWKWANIRICLRTNTVVDRAGGQVILKSNNNQYIIVIV